MAGETPRVLAVALNFSSAPAVVVLIPRVGSARADPSHSSGQALKVGATFCRVAAVGACPVPSGAEPVPIASGRE